MLIIISVIDPQALFTESVRREYDQTIFKQLWQAVLQELPLVGTIFFTAEGEKNAKKNWKLVIAPLLLGSPAPHLLSTSALGIFTADDAKNAKNWRLEITPKPLCSSSPRLPCSPAPHHPRTSALHLFTAKCAK
ncbi:MAG: hypothetical protein ABIA75_14035, partial [Candidatus Neomarinimicrobiota bacterium]